MGGPFRPGQTDESRLACRENQRGRKERVLQRRRAIPRHVNQPQSAAELIALQTSVSRGRPFGGDTWCKKVAKQMSLEHTYRSVPEKDSRPL